MLLYVFWFVVRRCYAWLVLPLTTLFCGAIDVSEVTGVYLWVGEFRCLCFGYLRFWVGNTLWYR